MSDAIVMATAKAKPGKEKDLERALREVAQPTRQQPGCTGFSLYRSQDSPGAIVGFERWATKADHERHLRGAHFQNPASAMADIIAGPPKIPWYEIIDRTIAELATGKPSAGHSAGCEPICRELYRGNPDNEEAFG
jgi:quinol monooxygenase YgiN